MKTAQQVKDQVIFIIENNVVEQTTLWDHIAASAREVCSPRGVMYEMFVEEVENAVYMGDVVEGKKWALKEWKANGHAKVIDLFDTEEEADTEWFRLHEAYDFAKDDQRNTSYWNTREEAEKELTDILSYDNE